MDDVLIWVLVSIALSLFGAFKKDKKKGTAGGPVFNPFDPDPEAEPWNTGREVVMPEDAEEVQPQVVLARKERKRKASNEPVGVPATVSGNPYSLYSDRIADWEKQYSQPDYNFFEEGMESIEHSAIGGDNEGIARTIVESQESILAGFSLPRAIIYTEILRPKYL